MRGRGVGGGAAALRHQRRQVSHRDHRGRDHEDRDCREPAGCCEEFTVKLTPILSCQFIAKLLLITTIRRCYGELARNNQRSVTCQRVMRPRLSG